MTVSDYYRNRYGWAVEIIVSLCIVVSYLGWEVSGMLAGSPISPSAAKSA